MTTIRIACDGALVPISELKVIQGDLKTLTKERFNELTKAIEDDGFSFAVHYWVNPETGEKCILDGTQRYRVASKNIQDGKWAEFQIPTVKIEAPDYKSAVKTLFHGASSYGTPDSQGYYELTESAGLTVVDLQEVALAGIDQKKHEENFYREPDFQPGSESEQGQLDEKKPIECPHCGKSFVKT